MKKMIKLILTTAILTTSVSALAAEDFIDNQDFKSLFNKYRYAQPQHIPWAGSYFPFRHQGTVDAMTKYDQIFNGGKNMAAEFERKHHSCEAAEAADREGCQGWWGHCNGWSGAAIKELEPRKSIDYNGVSLGVADQKGMLTELWLSANTLFLGTTHKRKTTSEWVYNPEDPAYKSFWDVTPRQMFFAFANQIGIQGTGVVIDRFTGDQVWNHPMVGYRILPLRAEDIGVQQFADTSLNYAVFRIKLFWAGDHVRADHISREFDINNTTDRDRDDSINEEYLQRKLTFKLFFDRRLEVDASGTQILNDVQLIGDGFWSAQETKMGFGDLDQSHPDFIWLPTNPLLADNGIANPHITWENIKSVADVATGGAVPPTRPPTRPPEPPPVVDPPPPVEPPTRPPVVDPPPVNPPPATGNQLTVTVKTSNVYDGDNLLIAERLIVRIFRRANLEVDVNQSRIRISGGQIEFVILASGSIDAQKVRAALEDAGAQVVSIR